MAQERRAGQAGPKRRRPRSTERRSCASPRGPLFSAAMKIYTRTGDDGSTGVLGPGRLPKHAPRVEAYGAVDELNAALGVARALDPGGGETAEVAAIQARLFALGAELATVEPAALAKLERIGDRDVAQLEGWIDASEAGLPALTRFILPGGAPLAAQLHLARTVCRRAERRVVALREREPVEPVLVRYLNRLADLLFVLARRSNARAAVAETEWGGARG